MSTPHAAPSATGADSQTAAWQRSCVLASGGSGPNSSVQIVVEPYTLQLRTAFGTSHSSSMQRTNGLVTVTFTQDGCDAVTGVGEAGMPPRKTGCYELTYSALQQQVEEWAAAVAAEGNEAGQQQQLYDPFTACPPHLYAAIRAELAAGTVSHPLLPSLLRTFRVLDKYMETKTPAATDAAFLCVVEAALMDAWGFLRKQQLCEMIGVSFDGTTEAAEEGDAPAASAGSAAASASASVSASSASASSLRSHRQPRSFYTLGMDSVEQMVSNLEFGLAYTPLIKIKVNDDAEATRAVLDAVVPAMLASPQAEHCRVSIDANSAWSSGEKAMEFLEVLRPYAQRICMVEQPFPLFRACPAYVSAEGAARLQRMIVQADGSYAPLADSVVEEWSRVADAYAAAGLPIYADESICTGADMRALRPALHGVNIKLEKAGGYRRALILLCEAQQAGVRTWLGCMVGSSRNSAQAAHLLPLSTPDCWGDLDGSLLTAPHSDRFAGGMIWTKDGKGSIAMHQGYGTAVTNKQ